VRLGISNIVTFFPGRNDIPNLLKSADLLLHPAYRESAGSIILEAVVAGLPVLVTDICGFAPHVSKAKAGIVLPRPFVQPQLNQALVEMLTSPEHQQWHNNAIQYGRTEDLYMRTPITVDQIERFSRGEN
jgi:UDP-glucose:(heptosyl)LPS alpha-1,3-glucosyltransferase